MSNAVIVGSLLMRRIRHFFLNLRQHSGRSGNTFSFVAIEGIVAGIVLDNVAVELHDHELVVSQILTVELRLHRGKVPTPDDGHSQQYGDDFWFPKFNGVHGDICPIISIVVFG